MIQKLKSREKKCTRLLPSIVLSYQTLKLYVFKHAAFLCL
jgi:hypothetical protein